MATKQRNWGDSQINHPAVFEELKQHLSKADSVQPVCEDFLDGLGVIVHGALTPEECKGVISVSEKKGYQAALDYCHLYRDRLNDRFMSDDIQLAQFLWERVQRFIPKEIVSPFDKDQTWKLDAMPINERFRFCKYVGGNGHHFGAHTDGMYRVDNTHMSLLTCMVYLNGGDEFEGGLTNFIELKSRRLKHSIKPEPGLCVIFRQANLDCYHEGTEVTKGLKYIMRTDVMYHTEE